MTGLAVHTAQAREAYEFFAGNASSRYDFVLRLAGSPCESPEQADYQTCEGPGTVEVRRKGEPRREVATLELDNLLVSLTHE